METKTKKCSRCKAVKPLTEFYKDKSRKDGLQPRCKPCSKAVVKEYQQTDKGKAMQARADRRHQAKTPPSVYKITCLENNRTYIGSSTAPKGRQSTHWSSLSLGTHNNKALQEDYDKYGKDAFEFSIIENCEEHELLVLEQRYIDQGENLYNVNNAVAQT